MYLSGNLDDCLIKNGNHLLNLFFRNDEGWSQKQVIPFYSICPSSTGIGDQSLLKSTIGDETIEFQLGIEWLFGLSILYKLNPCKKTLSPHIAYKVMMV